MPKFSSTKKRAREAEDSGGDAVVADQGGPSKKSKSKGGSSGSLGSGTDAEGNPYWELSAKRRVGISKFKSMLLVNVREFYDQDGELKPTKKGISLSVEQYQALLRAAPAINAELRKLGHDVDDPAPSESVGKTGKGEKRPKKSNYEATSDEESD